MEESRVYLDQNGYEEYLNEIERLKRKLQDNGKVASSSYVDAVGDGWHDNFSYEESQRQELMIVDEIKKRTKDLNRIVVVSRGTDDSVVDINDIVKISFSPDDEEYYKLVGKYIPNIDGDIQEISLNSPLGSAIYKRKVGDNISYYVNGNKINIQILEKKSC
jgi:transcription elongation factor GreA